jgi:hypothetical protein
VLFQTPATELTRHPDQSLATARVCVLTDLQPNQTIVFRAEASTSPHPPAQPSAGLQVTELGAHVALETATAGVKLPLGTFTNRGSIPAPYQGFRLTSGRWAGSSQLSGNLGPCAWTPG